MNKFQNFLLIIVFLIAGSSVTIVKKVLSKIECDGREFRHAWIYQNIMYFSELMTYFVYHYFYNDEEFRNLEENKNKLPPPRKLLIFSTIMAFFYTILTTFGLLLLPGSVFQMFRSSIILVTFIFSFFLTKNKHYIHHYIGLSLTLIGLILIAISTYTDTTIDKLEIILGIITTLIGIIAMAFNYTLEENITKKFLCHPMQCIYIEGFYGFILSCIVITILYLTPCNTENKIILKFCNVDDEKIRGENYFYAIKQVVKTPSALICILLYAIFISTTNNTGCAFSKHTSGTARAVVDTLRSIFVWIFFMMPFNVKNKETFKTFQFIGFIFLIAGNVFYNNLLQIKYSKDSKKNVNKIINQLSEQKIIDLDQSVFAIDNNINDDELIDQINKLNDINLKDKIKDDKSNNSNMNKTAETENSEEKKSKNDEK